MDSTAMSLSNKGHNMWGAAAERKEKDNDERSNLESELLIRREGNLKDLNKRYYSISQGDNFL